MYKNKYFYQKLWQFSGLEAKNKKAVYLKYTAFFGGTTLAIGEFPPNL